MLFNLLKFIRACLLNRKLGWSSSKDASIVSVCNSTLSPGELSVYGAPDFFLDSNRVCHMDLLRLILTIFVANERQKWDKYKLQNVKRHFFMSFEKTEIWHVFCRDYDVPHLHLYVSVNSVYYEWLVEKEKSVQLAPYGLVQLRICFFKLHWNPEQNDKVQEGYINVHSKK